MTFSIRNLFIAVFTAVAILVSSPNFAADPRIVVVSPAPNTIVRPGGKLHVRVDVDASLQATSVGVVAPIRTRIWPLELKGPPFEGDLVIPKDTVGAFDLMITVITASDDRFEGPVVPFKVISDETPVRIKVSPEILYLKPPKTPGDPLPDSVSDRGIRVQGYYANNIRRDLSGSLFGTTYTSSDPAIATVDTEGVVTPIAPGIVIITVENKGIKSYSNVKVNPLTGSLPPIDQTSKINFQGGGFLLDRATNQYVQQVKITNQSTLPLPIPLKLILTSLPNGVMLAEERGFTKSVAPLGSPYVDADDIDDFSLLPGQSVSFQIRFINYNNQPITYTPKLYSGRGL